MPFMPWSDDFLTGIQQIDDQHRWLVDAINKLHDANIQADPDREMVGDVLHGLVEYAINHFIVEEDLFKRFDYPESAAHLAEHNGFNRKATALLDQFEKGEAVNEAALEFLKDWLKHHILEIDMAYVPFFKEKDVG